MMQHEAFMGYTCDHLYQNCPNLVKVSAFNRVRHHIGYRCVDRVDPEGSDVCGMCVYRWRRKGKSDDS